MMIWWRMIYMSERPYSCPETDCSGSIAVNREGWAVVPCDVCGHDVTVAKTHILGHIDFLGHGVCADNCWCKPKQEEEYDPEEEPEEIEQMCPSCGGHDLENVDDDMLIGERSTKWFCETCETLFALYGHTVWTEVEILKEEASE
jgi:ribosomal protein L37AE/L43A